MTDAARPRARRGERATVVSTAVLGVLALVLTGFALRYMAVKASVGGSDGGANDQTLQVRIDGGDWVDSGTSYSEAHTRGPPSS